MRGKEAAPRLPCGAARITPASAGKSLSEKSIRPRLEDHPRVCGEKPVWPVPLPLPAGITPAYAGKRTTGKESKKRTRDHPRVCGEKYNYGMANKQAGGSPPRMRGKAVQSGMAHTTRRITPAYAGKSKVQRANTARL